MKPCGMVPRELIFRGTQGTLPAFACVSWQVHCCSLIFSEHSVDKEWDFFLILFLVLRGSKDVLINAVSSPLFLGEDYEERWIYY